ncbi:glycosylated lysosomal membrane protein isoform X1 [Canis lupus familiaris]|uniref:Glycosylated lysosomal membrane protein n=3 Tax=Canis lupus TaxID=9612 RepID=A0A8C0TAQ6_CANLF|nr:glycosylated lysosomal membrane protein isoform X1 [Canis lupus dingo]XP_038398969.1 glycosylated lysosomal membrane protein isoform X1 [Canis lupus familiaris]XP_038527802.1 glycosylated lysosomal membrane protein isoform X1 [Canis lupus familiaris]XP_854965.1 glycosylated lysosomal membrane protein isoform X1 [Canis lupus familiaris]|eukprot:XP_854965.1 glycosylated lysosomal membrane protein isoform X1 [Canis lupus familiaris]
MCRHEGPRWGCGRCAPSSMLLLIQLLSAAPFGLLGEETRQVSLEVIPDCRDPSPNLLHIRAVGSNSTLHYVWSSMGPPAVLLVATNTPHSTLTVNWSRLLSPEPDGGLTVLPKNSIQFSSALVFTRLFEFDSANTSEASAKPPGKPYPPYSLAEFSWNNITDSLDLATLSATFRGRPIQDPAGAFANGSLAFRVQAFTRSSRPAQAPRLLHSADTCQLEVALFGAYPRGNRSLFGLEVATLGQAPDCPSVQEQRSIDDEYAPAVFKLDQLLWGSLPSGFMQWRPVAFAQRQRGRESSLPCQASPLRPTLAYLLPQSPIVRAFFGPQTDFCAFNLTFGAPTGPGYWDEYYLSWSMLLGVGTPPVDALSPLILGIMAVALGAPGLMLLAGGIFLLLWHKQCSQYQPIN